MLALSAVLALAAPARARLPADPQVVARVELAAPARSPFLLHATLPVPKGIVPRDEGGRTKLAVLDHAIGGGPVPAQIEIVSRYPTGEADVVELFARVALGPEDRPGSRVFYSVVLDAGEIAPEPEIPASVRELLAPTAGRRFGLRTRDVFGNTYWADLSGSAESPSFGSLRLVKSGRWLRQRRLYATLAPVETPETSGPPLPHLMGVHAYLTERAGEELVSLDLRVNNGASSGSRDPHALESTLGIVYWTSLELVLPKAWSAIALVRDPFLGEPYEEGDSRVIPLVKPMPDGKLHMMPPQAQFERRLALVPMASAKMQAPPDDRERQSRASVGDVSLFDPGLAFCVRGEDLWSWFEPATARYFAQRDLLASVDLVKRHGKSGKAAVRAMLSSELAGLREGIETGNPKGYYVTASVMGWAHPWFGNEQGGVGGEGIATFEGHYAAASASREGVLYLDLLHRMNVCRQPQASYDYAGNPVAYHAWLDKEGKIPFDFRLNGGVLIPSFLLPCARGPAASPQVLEVVKRGLRPPYDQGTAHEAGGDWPGRPDNLIAWWPHDDQHYIRYTKNAKALVWLANDAMAKDDLILAAEMYHLVRHESPHDRASWSWGATLRVLEAMAKNHPHQGLPVGREDAWGIDAMCAAYSVASPEWRERNRAWFGRMAQVLEDGAMPSGLVQRMVNEQLLPTKYAVAQAFECLFLVHAMRCMSESVFRGVEDARRAQVEKLSLRAIDYLFWGPPWKRVPNEYQPDPARPTLYRQGPAQGIAIAPNDDYASPPFSDEARWGPKFLPPDGLTSWVEWFHPWSALSWAQEITDATEGKGLENKYLKRAIDCGTPHSGWKDLVRDFAEQASDPSYDNSANWIGFLGKLQSLGVR